jgi:uncharacterized protein YcbK (DUF882 family)
MARPPALAACAVVAALGGAGVAAPLGVDPAVSHTQARAHKKGPALEPPGSPLLATLVQTHTEERVMLDERAPDGPRFDALLADRVTGSRQALDGRLLELLRALARMHPGARLELVSGYRSPKLNEMLRKKGHNVASHSQHSLGHAVDFRVVPGGETSGLDPRALETEIRALGWTGGVGVYTGKDDWFVHADVGPNRRWGG